MRDKNQYVKPGAICNGWYQTENGFEEKGRNGNKQQDVVQFRNVLMINIQFNGLHVCQHNSNNHYNQNGKFENVIDKYAGVQVRSFRRLWGVPNNQLINKLFVINIVANGTYSLLTPTNSKIIKTMVITTRSSPANSPRNVAWQSAYTIDDVLKSLS